MKKGDPTRGRPSRTVSIVLSPMRYGKMNKHSTRLLCRLALVYSVREETGVELHELMKGRSPTPHSHKGRKMTFIKTLPLCEIHMRDSPTSAPYSFLKIAF